jgi:uncharacterized SAM-binding protein YcdF (DUF218 family)
VSLLYAIAGVLRVFVSLPGVLLVPLAAGALLLRRSRRAGWSLIAATCVVAWALATPYVGASFLRALQTSPAVDPRLGREALRERADAIVVLAAEQRAQAPEYTRPSIGAFTLERVRYAAELARRSGLPVCTSGGVPERGEPALADAMAGVLEDEFGVAVRWREGRSANTRDNALESAALLRAEGVRRVYVVTHAWHMPRALLAFRGSGLEAVPAPTAFRAPARLALSAFWPTARALRESSLAWHETVGLAYYRLRP